MSSSNRKPDDATFREVAVSSAGPPPGGRPTHVKANIVLAVVAFLVVLITFLFWYQTWFGRLLSDSDMSEYLTDTSVPHKTQHALSQLADRMARGDASAARWYPDVLRLAENPEPQFRMMAAWVMGQDTKPAEFHQALRKLIADPEPMVRWNAALALVRFGDDAGEPVLRTMLEPQVVRAPQAGTLTQKPKVQDTLRRGEEIATLRTPGGEVKILSPVVGTLAEWKVQDGSSVAAGQEIAVLSPSEEQVWEALRALYFVGGQDDLKDVEIFARATSRASERVRQQAALTLLAIQKRLAEQGSKEKAGTAKSGT